MKYTSLNPNEKRRLTALLKKYPLVIDIAKAIDTEGKALLVGGAVRDLILGLPVKDLDIEVHDLSLQQLEDILKKFGPVSLVGKQFGVLRLHNLDADWSVPRIDEPGRKPKVKIDPFMGIKQAFKRRDLTINAMGIDILTKELIDPFGGLKDLKDRILRAPDIQLFLEDPLRFFRVMQFIGRFEMQPDKELNNLCASMDISGVSRERIEKEFEKLFLKSKRPSLGLRWLDKIGRLKDVLPELAATKGIPQDPKWHPEGDVFEHTMQTIDAAAAMSYKTDFDKLVMLYAALCHDLGKVNTTKEVEGSLKSLGHAKEGERLAKRLLKRITHNKELIKTVAKLVYYHMQPVQLVHGKAKLSAYKRLANKLAPEATLQMLAQLSLADRQGRNAKSHEPFSNRSKEIDQFLKMAHKANVLAQHEEPILHGRDLLDVMEPGPEMGKLVKQAYKIQIDEGIQNKEELKRRVLKK
jgi:tRNA nucleotidyltransferase (CCA-adding enzyme)